MPAGPEIRSITTQASPRSAPVLAACLLLVACSAKPTISARDAADANDTGGTLTGSTAQERTLLQELPRLPSGPAREFGGLSVVADQPYPTASGRTCRSLRLRAAKTNVSRLACTDGTAWFFVPDVFGDTEQKE